MFVFTFGEAMLMLETTYRESRTSLDPQMVKKYPIRLGISANVDVNITDVNLPMIAQMPSTKPVCTTAVFDIHMEEVEKSMDGIIMSNLEQ